MRRKITAFTAHPESGPRQRQAQLPKKLVQTSCRCLAPGPQQMVVRPETELVKADREWVDAYCSGGNRQLWQTHFRHIAEKGQGQVDGVASRGPTTKRQGSIPGDIAQTSCHFV